MDDSGDSCDINQPVYLLPAFPQPANHRCCRGDRQRNQEDEAGESRRHVGALDNVFDDSLKIKEVIEHHEGREVQQYIEEGEQAQHPPELDQVIPS